MSKYFNIILISSDENPTRQIQIKKTLVYTIVLLIFCLSGTGYYLFFSDSLAENPSHAQYRKKIARKNLKLTKRVLALKESHNKYSEELNELENSARQTMQAANVDLNIQNHEKEENNPMSFFQVPEEKNIGELFEKTSLLNNYFDSIIVLLNQNEKIIEFLPTMIPVSKKSFIIREFGKVKDPFSNKRSYHTGLDFSGQPGDSVFSPGSGEVKTVETDPFYGRTIRITHNKHTETFFAHLQMTHVKSGDKIKRGQMIGTLGSSGKTTGPHLHYEILVNGEKLDPSEIYLYELDRPFLAQLN